MKLCQILLTLLVPTICFADAPRCASEVCFSSTHEQLPLRGAGTLRYYGFRVYDAALYSAEPTPCSKTLCYFEFHFFMGFTGEQFGSSGTTLLEKNTTINLPRLRPLLPLINALYPAVKDGDTYTISYNPETQEMRHTHNQKSQGSISLPPEAARDYLSLWLSPEFGVGKSFVRKLLGHER